MTDEPNKGVQGNNERTTEVNDQQRWHPDPCSPQIPELQGSSAETFLNEAELQMI